MDSQKDIHTNWRTGSFITINEANIFLTLKYLDLSGRLKLCSNLRPPYVYFLPLYNVYTSILILFELSILDTVHPFSGLIRIWLITCCCLQKRNYGCALAPTWTRRNWNGMSTNYCQDPIRMPTEGLSSGAVQILWYWPAIRTSSDKILRSRDRHELGADSW